MATSKLKYTMKIAELSEAVGISARKIRELHQDGLVHSPKKRLWPKENIELINRYVINKNYIHKDTVRTKMLRDVLTYGKSCRVGYTIVEKSYSPENLYNRGAVIKFTQNDNSGVSMEELVVRALRRLEEAGTVFHVPRDSVSKGLSLAGNGYNPCWVCSFNFSVRTTIDLLDTSSDTFCGLSGESQRVLNTCQVIRWVCNKLGIRYVAHSKPLAPTAILTQKEGDNFIEYAVFAEGGSRPKMKPIGILL